MCENMVWFEVGAKEYALQLRPFHLKYVAYSPFVQKRCMVRKCNLSESILVMHKVSIVGIDNAGKSSIVRSLGEIDSVHTIRLTGGLNKRSIYGKAVNRLAEIGESRNMKFLAGFAYLLHLFPYFREQRANVAPVLVSDRDPIVDTVCYADFYLPKGLSKLIRPPLKYVLERSFGYPGSFCYLDVSPEVAAQRSSSQLQLHERLQSLRRLKELFEEEMSLVEKKGIPVIRVEADATSLEDATHEIRCHPGSLRDG